MTLVVWGRWVLSNKFLRVLSPPPLGIGYFSTCCNMLKISRTPHSEVRKLSWSFLVFLLRQRTTTQHIVFCFVMKVIHWEKEKTCEKSELLSQVQVMLFPIFHFCLSSGSYRVSLFPNDALERTIFAEQILVDFCVQGFSLSNQTDKLERKGHVILWRESVQLLQLLEHVLPHTTAGSICTNKKIARMDPLVGCVNLNTVLSLNHWKHSLSKMKPFWWDASP